ncbi:MAG: AAA family ATPase [Verrucomicrobia bacterium]|nr:AAA family ATPase [Verrucomicrobiota bacterium]
MPKTQPIAQTTKQAYALVTPDEALPSGDPRYVPLDAARGTKNAAQSLAERISALGSAVEQGGRREFARFLVTGHSGCGKTTELNRLKDLLTRTNLAVVYFDAESEFDLQKQNVSWWNILLEVIWQIDTQLSEPPYRLQLPEGLRNAATEWLARTVTKKTQRLDIESSLETEFGVDASLPFFAKAKAVFKALIKAGSSTVREIEQEAERRPNVLLEAVTDIVNHVDTALQKERGRGLVIVVDGLEKIPLRSVGDGLTTHNLLFIHAGNYLKTPPCHMVYSLPLALLASANVGQVFPEQPVIMPMVRVRHRDGRPDAHGIRALVEVIGRRVDSKLFAPGVLKRLALASGGHIRDFLRLVREAAAGFGKRVTTRDADRAVAQLVDTYNRLIEGRFIERLDYIDQHQERLGGPEDGELINRLLVLEYRNDETWAALHPCVKQSPRYVRSPRDRKEEKA